MAIIQVLDQAVAELIAAGEVVERPASVVKELLENALDAGASVISVEIEEGGVRRLQVSDNGTGIVREDVPRAFLRHATSKIRTASDLDSILTLGFRGEALASIAAMARVELTTRTVDEAEGTTCRIAGGLLEEIVPAGCPTGTTIIVRDLFYNTPARMKFLKKNATESSYVTQIVEKCALSHPEVSFRLVRDGQEKLRTSGSGELLAAIHAVFGREFAASMIPVDYVHENIVGVTGYISSPAGVRPSRTWQNFFINNRYVRTRTAVAALEEAFKNRIMSGRFPTCVLNLELDAATVDVNVHPTKTEVRFAQEKPVFSAVYFAVKTALAKQPEQSASQGGTAADIPIDSGRAYPLPSIGTTAAQPTQRMSAQEFQTLFGSGEQQGIPQSTFNKPATLAMVGAVKKPDIYVEEDIITFTPRPQSGKISPFEHGTIFAETAAKAQESDTISIEDDFCTSPRQTTLAAMPELRVIGELMSTYILLEHENALVLVDKHAAHERILYERLKENIAYGNRQLLLVSQTVVLPQEDYAALVEHLDTVEQLGFLVEDFGDGAVIVRETPIELGERDIAQIIEEVADRLKTGRHDLTPSLLDRLYYSIACKSAMRAGDRNTLPELDEIVRKLRENPQITHCPHGRPVQVQLSRHEIEKLFGRLG